MKKNTSRCSVYICAMNTTLKTVLLTVLTLSIFAVAILELSGVSSYSISNLFKKENPNKLSPEEQSKRDAVIKTMEKTTMEVPDTKFNFGKIKDGDKVRHTWKIKNTGTAPLMVSNVVTSCGCTAPFFSKEPIAPGKEGEVTLEFNSSGKAGHVAKNAHILANIENSPFPISFEADVEK